MYHYEITARELMNTINKLKTENKRIKKIIKDMNEIIGGLVIGYEITNNKRLLKIANKLSLMVNEALKGE